MVAHAIPRELHSDLAIARGDSTSDDVAVLAEQMLSGDSAGAMPASKRFAARALLSRRFTCSCWRRRQFICGGSGPAIYAVLPRRHWRCGDCNNCSANTAWSFVPKPSDRKPGGASCWRQPRGKSTISVMRCSALVLMSEFFRRDGWEAWIEPDPTAREFTRVVHDEWFDVVEFLVSGDKQLDALAARYQDDPARIAESVDRNYGSRSGFHRASRIGFAGGRRSHGNRRETGGVAGPTFGWPDRALLSCTNKTNKKGVKG